MLDREVGEPDDVVGGFSEHLLNFGQLLAGDGVEPLAYMVGVGLGEDGADRRRDHREHGPWEPDRGRCAGSAPADSH